MRKLLSIILLLASTFSAFSQDGHIIYNDQSNHKLYGRDVLVRSDAANLDTLTSVYAGSMAFDTIHRMVKVYDGYKWSHISFGSVKDTIITVVSASVLTLNSVPVTAVNAPGSGFAIDVISSSMRMVYNSAGYTTNTTLELTMDGAGTEIVAWASGSLSSLANSFTKPSAVASQSVQLIENAALTIAVGTGDPTAGDSDITVYIRYSIIKL